MIRRAIAKGILKLGRWELGGETPTAPRCVVLAHPHTSNWDLLYMMCFSRVSGLRVSWLGKHTLFNGVQGRLLRAFGGIPVDRRAPGGVVAQLVEELRNRDKLAIMIPPSGTRGYRDHWKSGFYHVATTANVPVVLSYLDYGTRRGGFGPTVRLTGDIRHDMDGIRAFYGGMTGKRPDSTSKIRLREEDALAAAPGPVAVPDPAPSETVA